MLLPSELERELVSLAIQVLVGHIDAARRFVFWYERLWPCIAHIEETKQTNNNNAPHCHTAHFANNNGGRNNNFCCKKQNNVIGSRENFCIQDGRRCRSIQKVAPNGEPAHSRSYTDRDNRDGKELKTSMDTIMECYAMVMMLYTSVTRKEAAVT